MIIGIDASRAATEQRTGTEAYARNLIRALIPPTAERGHRLRLYFNQPPVDGLFPTAPHVEHVVIPQHRLWTHLRLGRELRRRPPNVFFTPAHVIPAGYRGPSVATIHDLGYEYFPEAHPRRQLAYLRWSTRHNARVARRVIADSAATRDDLAKFYDVPVSKIDVVYPGADPYMRRVTDEARIAGVLTAYGIRPPYFLYLGTLQPRKISSGSLRRLSPVIYIMTVTRSFWRGRRVGWPIRCRRPSLVCRRLCGIASACPAT